MAHRNYNQDVLATLTESLPRAKLGRFEVFVGLVFVVCLSVTVLVVYQRWDSSVPRALIETELSELSTRADKAINSTVMEDTETVEVISPVRLVAVLPSSNDSAFSGAIGEIYFRPGSHLLAVSEDRGFVKLYDSENGVLRRTFSERERDYFRMAFSPDGALLAASSRGGVYCWRTATGELEFDATGVVVSERGQRVGTMLNVTGNIAFSGDGNYLAVCNDDRVAILNTTDGSTHQVLNGDSRKDRTGGYQVFRCLCFANSTNQLYVGSWHSEDAIYTVEGWRPGGERLTSSALMRSPASRLASSRDGKSIAMQTDNGEIAVMWIVSAGPPGSGRRARLKVRSAQANALVFSSDDRFLIAGGPGNQIRLWLLDSDNGPMRFTSEGLPITAAEKIAGPSVTRLAASDDGSFLACGCSDGRVRVLRFDSM